MKRLVVLLGTAILATAFSASALASGKAAPPNYLPGAHVDIVMYVDTVAAAKSSLGYVPAKAGVQASFFPQTAGVTFRMWAVETGTGNVLAAKDLRAAYVKIPGQPNVPLVFAKQGTAANAPWFWTGTWSVPADFPVGPVAYQVLVRTKVGYKLGVFDPSSLAAASRLNVFAKPA